MPGGGFSRSDNEVLSLEELVKNVSQIKNQGLLTVSLQNPKFYDCAIVYGDNCQDETLMNFDLTISFDLLTILIIMKTHRLLDVAAHSLIFLAHLSNGNVSFCHHLASVNFSHFNLLL